MSFPKELTAAQSNAVVAANRFQSQVDRQLEALVAFDLSQQIMPQEEIVVWQDEGAGLLKNFCVKLDEPAAAEVMSSNLRRGYRLRVNLRKLPNNQNGTQRKTFAI